MRGVRGDGDQRDAGKRRGGRGQDGGAGGVRRELDSPLEVGDERGRAGPRPGSGAGPAQSVRRIKKTFSRQIK